MADFLTTMSIFRGDVPVNETSDTAGTLSATVNNYLLTVDDAKLVSMNTTMMPLNNHTNHVVITILAKA